MLNPIVGHIALGIYAVLLAVGGVMGFVKARSRPSLIAGLVSAVAALAALGLALRGASFGFPLGLLLSTVLFVFFGYRYANRNRKFMPAGLMTIVSLVVTVIMVLVLGS
jgi:uncharacterized membrane protein (UPF0136 family)